VIKPQYMPNTNSLSTNIYLVATYHLHLALGSLTVGPRSAYRLTAKVASIREC
jgi:hypothetical protein